MKTTTLFILCIIVCLAIVIPIFCFYPTLAGMTHNFIFVWLPEKVTGLIAYANQSLAVIGVSSITAIIGTFSVANYLHKRWKTGNEQTQQLVNQTNANLLLKKDNTIDELTSTVESKDKIIEQLQSSDGVISKLTAENDSLKKSLQTTQTERNLLDRIGNPSTAEMIKRLQKEGYVVKVPVK